MADNIDDITTETAESFRELIKPLEPRVPFEILQESSYSRQSNNQKNITTHNQILSYLKRDQKRLARLEATQERIKEQIRQTKSIIANSKLTAGGYPRPLPGQWYLTNDEDKKSLFYLPDNKKSGLCSLERNRDAPVFWAEGINCSIEDEDDIIYYIGDGLLRQRQGPSQIVKVDLAASYEDALWTPTSRLTALITYGADILTGLLETITSISDKLNKDKEPQEQIACFFLYKDNGTWCEVASPVGRW